MESLQEPDWKCSSSNNFEKYYTGRSINDFA